MSNPKPEENIASSTKDIVKDPSVDLDLELPKVGLADWLRTIPFLLSFWTSFLISETLQRLNIFGLRVHDGIYGLLNKFLVLELRKITGLELNVSNPHDLPKDRPLIVVSNHQAIFDIPILHQVFKGRNAKFVAKKQLAHGIPGVSYNMRRGHHALIDRDNPRQALETIKEFGFRTYELECAAVLFPEGTRAKRGKLGRFRHAGIAMLLQTVPDALIVPVTIDGTWKLSAYKCFPVPKNVEVNVVVGEPLNTRDWESFRDLSKTIYSAIRSQLIEIRNSQD